MRTLLLALCAMVLMTGCAAKQNMQQVGGTAVSWTSFEVEVMRDTPKIEPIQCPISQLKEYKYFIEKDWEWYRADKWFSKEKPNQFFWACPDEHMDERNKIHLASWSPTNMTWQDSPFRTVVPGIANMFGYVAGAGTLGATMPRNSVTQSGSGVNLRASTVAGEVPGGVPR